MWDPDRYLDYAQLRGRPFHELLARVGAIEPRRVVDLGCGPGNLTGELPGRWPGARIEALDSSPEMVEAARAAGVRAHVGDVREYEPQPDTDVLITNAVLQWVPEHRELLRHWATRLPAGAWLALQVPGNFAASSHALVRELAAQPHWRRLLHYVRLRPPDAVEDPQGYAELLAAQGCAVDAWETTYLQPLAGENPVLEWISGTALRPITAALDEPDWQRFRAELAPMLAKAYPARADGTTWFPFRRVFAVARTATS